MKALLGSILVVLAMVIGLELRPGKPPVASVPNVRPSPQQAAVSAVDTNLDKAWITTILGRPLFTPSRRPAAAVVAGPGERRPLPRLSGIVMDGKRRSAIFAAPDKHRPVVVAEGGEIEGFRIEAIDANGVVLTGSGTRQVLRPSFDPNAVPPPVPPPAPAAPPPPPPPGAFNGPPGLSTMPKPPASPPAAGPPGLPGLPSLSNLSGIPGLSPSPAPNQ